mgnify:CR=1 FL=1
MGEGVREYDARGLVVSSGRLGPHLTEGAVLVVYPVYVILDLENAEEGVEEDECLVRVGDGVRRSLVLTHAERVLDDVVGGLDLPPELVRLRGLVAREVEC